MGGTAALASALIRLLRDPALARLVGDQAADDAQGPYAWTTQADVILAKLGA